MSNSFGAYTKRIMRSHSTAENLDAAVDLAACVWKSIHGSGPLYHRVEGLTTPEQGLADGLAKRVRAVLSARPTAEQVSELADAAFDFAISLLVARGAQHLGAPKVLLARHQP